MRAGSSPVSGTILEFMNLSVVYRCFIGSLSSERGPIFLLLIYTLLISSLSFLSRGP